MNINAVFPSNYLKADQFEEDRTVTIREVKIESLGQGSDADDKPILYFEETEKGLVLNRTNANTVAGMYGPETDAWTGQRVTLGMSYVDFQGKQTASIRVRPKRPTLAPTRAAPATDPAVAARLATWNKFKAANPILTDADAKATFKRLVESVHEAGVDMNALGAGDWAAVDAAIEAAEANDIPF